MLWKRGAAGMPGCALVLLLSAPAAGQRLRSVAVRLDNDILAPRGRGAPPDYDYTQGLSIVAELDSFRACARCARTRVGAGQRIYTPRRDAPEPIPGERPYAAWLYAGAELDLGDAARERTASVEVGVTGKPALGEPVQNGAHRLLSSEPQRGWAHQLGFEPGILLRYREGYPIERPVHRLGAARLVPRWSVSVGNVRTAADAGASLRIGRVSGAYAEAVAREEWIARDLFLDGNTFRGNSSARKLPLVAEGQLAIGYRARSWAAEYRATLRAREYRAQPAAHPHGSLTVTLGRAAAR